MQRTLVAALIGYGLVGGAAAQCPQIETAVGAARWTQAEELVRAISPRAERVRCAYALALAYQAGARTDLAANWADYALRYAHPKLDGPLYDEIKAAAARSAGAGSQDRPLPRQDESASSSRSAPPVMDENGVQWLSSSEGDAETAPLVVAEAGDVEASRPPVAQSQPLEPEIARPRPTRESESVHPGTGPGRSGPEVAPTAAATVPKATVADTAAPSRPVASASGPGTVAGHQARVTVTRPPAASGGESQTQADANADLAGKTAVSPQSPSRAPEPSPAALDAPEPVSGGSGPAPIPGPVAGEEEPASFPPPTRHPDLKPGLKQPATATPRPKPTPAADTTVAVAGPAAPTAAAALCRSAAERVREPISGTDLADYRARYVVLTGNDWKRCYDDDAQFKEAINQLADRYFKTATTQALGCLKRGQVEEGKSFLEDFLFHDKMLDANRQRYLEKKYHLFVALARGERDTKALDRYFDSREDPQAFYGERAAIEQLPRPQSPAQSQ